MVNKNFFGMAALIAGLMLVFACTALSLTGCDDGNGGAASAGTAPVITTSLSPDGTVGMAYIQSLAASGDMPMTWSVESGALPAGLTLSRNTIAGNPTSTETYNFTLKAANAAGSDTKAFSITIAPGSGQGPGQGTAPAISATSLWNGAVGTAYRQPLAATGDAPITWSVESGVLPAGLNLFQLQTGNAIAGTPSTVGTFNFTLKAANAAGADTRALSIRILPYGGNLGIAPTINTTSLPNGVEGTAYSQALSASGTAPIIWSLESGALPTGLSISAAGSISGTPSAAGTFSFTVEAANAAGADTRALSITIAPVPVAPPTITTTSLPDGNVGGVYNQTLAATGTAPIAWSRESGALPTGLTLSGNTISGTPTTEGTSTFTVRATNTVGNDTKALSITITSIGTSKDNAIPLTENVWAEGNLPTQEDVQWFSFTATASTQYLHAETGTLSYLSALVQDSDSEFIASSWLGEDTKNFSLALTPGQTYYIRAGSSYTGTTSGTYRIAFSAFPYPPGTTFIPLTFNIYANCDLPASASTGDHQWFTFTATATMQYIHIQFLTLTGLYVQVYDSGGTAVGNEAQLQSYDSANRNFSRSLAVGQVYYIRVRPYGSARGTYQIGFATSTTAPSSP